MPTNAVTDFEEALSILDSYVNFERMPPAPGKDGFGGERMAELLRRLGSPHTAQPAIHIAGTKGKGSTSHMTAAVLRARGLRVGLYTSPHVNNLLERIQVDGRPLEAEGFVAGFHAAHAVAEEMRAAGMRPTWFEMMTAVAFLAFRTAKVDAAVLETGLGGRLDATNLADLPVLACGITTISLDHQEILGKDLLTIAGEKAGIIRPNVPLVIGSQEDTVADFLDMKAMERECGTVLRMGREISYEPSQPAPSDSPMEPQRMDLEVGNLHRKNIPVAMMGDHQLDNAAMAAALSDLALASLRNVPADTLAFRRAWFRLRIPGRMETLSSLPWLIVDAAHNPASVWAATETIRQRFTSTNRTLIFAASADKNIVAMLRILAPLMQRVILTKFDSPRCYDPSDALAMIRKEFPSIAVSVNPYSKDALDQALRETHPEDGLILAAGSFYLAGEIRAAAQAKGLEIHPVIKTQVE